MLEGIHHYPLSTIKDASFFANEAFDIIILCNAPAAAAPLRLMAPSARLVFWAHVLPDQASMRVLANAATKQFFDATIFVSSWQQEQVERAFGAFGNAHVIGNGIAPAFENMFESPRALLEAKQNRAAYASTPYRGLSVLVRSMVKLERATNLDVFSSMRVYQADDSDYAALLQEAMKNPKIVCHGSVIQCELAQHFRDCAFLFYPCIYPETFCIVAAEAMAAGMAIVTTRIGALEETTHGFADLVRLNSTDGDVLVRDFRVAMQRNVDSFATHPERWGQERFAQMQWANAAYTWRARAVEWERRLIAAEP